MGREWRSAEGGRSLQGDFLRLANDSVAITPSVGPPLVIKLDALSFADQNYARTAQAAVDQSMKLGPKSFEISRVLSRGALCRFAMVMGNGSTLFTGEEFMLLADPSSLKQGERRKAQTLYPAGDRTFHPTQGDPSTMRAFALTLDAAVMATLDLAAGTNRPDIYEPIIETVEARGLGIAVGEAGMVLVDSNLLTGSTSIDLDMGKEHSPGTVIAASPELGVTILAGKGLLTPARLAPRKPILLGQSIFALGFGLSSTGKAIGEPTITKGIVSKLGTGDKRATFEHDAARNVADFGGLILGEKGDVLGMMVTPPSIKKARGAKASPASEPMTPAALGQAIRSDDISTFLKTVPKTNASRSAPTSDLAESAKSLRASMIIVKVIKETVREVTPPPLAAANSSPSPEAGVAAGWSLSKSGTRHNSKCRYYDASKPCQGSDGKPCKTCGG